MFTNSSNRIRIYILIAVFSCSSLLIWHFSSAERIAKIIDPSKNDIASPSLRNDIGNSLLTIREKQLTEITESINKINKRLDKMQNKLVVATLAQPIQEVDLLDVELSEEQDPDIEQDIDRQEADQHYEEKINSLQTQLVKEPVDEVWLTEVEDTVHSAIEKLSELYVLDDFVCGSTICKLEASMKPINGEGDFSSGPGIDHLVHGEMAWTGQSLSEVDTETGKATVYLIRHGENVTSEES